jgi:hypothetical protein
MNWFKSSSKTEVRIEQKTNGVLFKQEILDELDTCAKHIAKCELAKQIHRGEKPSEREITIQLQKGQLLAPIIVCLNKDMISKNWAEKLIDLILKGFDADENIAEDKTFRDLIDDTLEFAIETHENHKV